MDHIQLVMRFSLTLALLAMGNLWEQLAVAQDFVLPKQIDRPVIADYPIAQPTFAVGGTARKALPALECLHCVGPAPCVPCDSHRRGFLYYDTPAAIGAPQFRHHSGGMTHAWIRFQQRCRRPFCWLRAEHTECGDRCAN